MKHFQKHPKLILPANHEQHRYHGQQANDDHMFQMHRNLRTQEKDNAPEEFILSTADQKSCKGGTIRLSVQADGKAYTVSIPSKSTSRTYRAGRAVRRDRLAN